VRGVPTSSFTSIAMRLARRLKSFLTTGFTTRCCAC
jgi:hypothetical protein